MHQSGTKLVIALGCLALLAGATSWWYRYAATHRATEFWGSPAAQLIARSAQAEVIELATPPANVCSALASGEIGSTVDLSRARGMAHLRHALMCDRNYAWDESIDAASVEWRWCWRFHDAGGQADVLLSNHLSVIGKCDRDSHRSVAMSCRPMMASLKHYFDALGLVDASNGP